MNLNREDNQFLLIAFVIIVLITIVGAVLLLREDPEVTTIPVEEWCEVGTVGPDGTITYSGHGPTEIMVFATESGPKLMAKCE